MDLLLKATATAAFVVALLLLLRHAGPRLHGLAAALPVSSAPALFWLGLERGAGFAANAACAALLSTALAPLVAAVYGLLSARRGPLPCLLASLGVGALALWLLLPCLGQQALGGLALALALSALALRLLPRAEQAPARRRDWRRELALTAGVAGLLTLLIGALAQAAGAGLCGALAALPVVCLSTVCGTHRAQGSAVACRFLVGYVDGNAAKAVFLALLAGALDCLPLGLAWAAALLGGLVSLTLLLLRQRTQPLKPAPSSL